MNKSDLEAVIIDAVTSVIANKVAESVARQVTSERVDALVSPHVEATLSALGAPSVESTTPVPTKTVEVVRDKRAKAKANAKGYISVPAATPNVLEGSGTNPDLDPDRVAEGVANARKAVAEWYKTATIPAYKNWTRQSRLPGLFTGLVNKLESGGLIPHVRNNVAELSASPDALAFFIEGANIVIDAFINNGSSELVNRANAIGATFDQALSALV